MLTEEAWLLIAVLILVAFQLAPWRWTTRRDEEEIAYLYVIERR
jgi:hypothetical protein